MAPPGTPGGGFRESMPPTICIYTLLTILPVYHYRPRCTGEGVREAQIGKNIPPFPPPKKYPPHQKYIPPNHPPQSTPHLCGAPVFMLRRQAGHTECTISHRCGRGGRFEVHSGLRSTSHRCHLGFEDRRVARSRRSGTKSRRIHRAWLIPMKYKSQVSSLVPFFYLTQSGNPNPFRSYLLTQYRLV